MSRFFVYKIERVFIDFFVSIVFLSVASLYVSYLLRFDFSTWQMQYAKSFLIMLPILIFIRICCFYLFKLNYMTFRYASYPELLKIIKANTFALIIFIFTMNGLIHFKVIDITIPCSIFVLDYMVYISFCAATRGFIRLYLEWLRLRDKCDKRKRFLIIGGGNLGINTAKLLSSMGAPYGGEVVGFIDDDPIKRKMQVHGRRVLGMTKDVSRIVKKYNVDIVVLAINDYSKELLNQLVSDCKGLNIELKIKSAMGEDYRGKDYLGIEDVSVTDLLGRQSCLGDNTQVRSSIENKSVFVSGAAGSIGSELSRQIAALKPKLLILFDMAESPLYELEQELIPQAHTEINAIVGDIKHKYILQEIFEIYHIDIVYHAAAYKHVPLMEKLPCEAVLNNIMGTRNLLEVADKYNVGTFVMISTDKAVRPTNIMGATKRICELMIQCCEKSQTKFAAVRFGNVLGSNGSVIPLFKKQIKNGGPITITHRDIERYFMLIPEAVHLVLQCSAMALHNDIFVLDMGEPVKILDLAKKMLELASLKEGVDVDIVEVGLRPGEKMYEELVTYGETLTASQVEKINVLKKHKNYLTKAELFERVDEIFRLAQAGDSRQVIKHIWQLIYDTYDEKIN